jgi:hypothetical protein
MSITATVQQGKIVLPANVDWPSGTVVRIEPVRDQPPTLWETLKDFDGIANDLPADLAANLDQCSAQVNISRPERQYSFRG